jgi:hypothetical protein
LKKKKKSYPIRGRTVLLEEMPIGYQNIPYQLLAIAGRSIMPIVLFVISCSDGMLNSGSDVESVKPTDNNEETDSTDIWWTERCGLGVDAYDICWYLGASGQSCTDTCAAFGGVSPDMALHVGTPAQGGSREDCTFLLNLLKKSYVNVIRITAPPTQQGLGCYRFADGLYWITYVPFDPVESCYGVEMVCGCLGNETVTP